MIIEPASKSSPAYPSIFIILVIILALVTIFVAIFFLYTSITMINTLKNIETFNKEDILKLSTRLFATFGLNIVWIICLFLAATPITKAAYAHILVSSILKLALSAIAVINMVSILNSGKKKSSVSRETKKTQTQTQTQTRGDQDKELDSNGSEPEEGSLNESEKESEKDSD